MAKICLYLHVHQPHRLAKLNYLDLGNQDDYFGEKLPEVSNQNREILLKVAQKSYLPTNKILLKLLKKYPAFNLSLSITGNLIEQCALYAPEVIDSFKELVATGRVEILSETYYHSLAALHSVEEFAQQIVLHRSLVKSVFGYETRSFRNTELIYNDKIASYIQQLGFKATITEGWEPVLAGKSAHHVYNAVTEKLTSQELAILNSLQIRKPYKQLKLLLKSYKLSDDVAFRFSDKSWVEYPLTPKKFANWISNSEGQLVNLFMDYETFGEHQWEDTGIFKFLKGLPGELLAAGHEFSTISEAASGRSSGPISIPELISWADMERDLSAWNGNKMQKEALSSIYQIEEFIQKLQLARNQNSQISQFISTWRRLQTSDHFYYMSTKYWSDGDVHKYFSPYESPYEAFINYMNIVEDFRKRLEFILE